MHPELWEVALLDEMERDERRGGGDDGWAGCAGCGCLLLILLALLGIVGQCAGGG
ncbi:MAG TPA: hypothetical protein VFX50_14670 [Gemmatimonadales bacterium]|nr:hypothetical protein [Gemmatimonadales bacterium]